MNKLKQTMGETYMFLIFLVAFAFLSLIGLFCSLSQNSILESTFFLLFFALFSSFSIVVFLQKVTLHVKNWHESSNDEKDNPIKYIKKIMGSDYLLFSIEGIIIIVCIFMVNYNMFIIGDIFYSIIYVLILVFNLNIFTLMLFLNYISYIAKRPYKYDLIKIIKKDIITLCGGVFSFIICFIYVIILLQNSDFILGLLFSISCILFILFTVILFILNTIIYVLDEQISQFSKEL